MGAGRGGVRVWILERLTKTDLVTSTKSSTFTMILFFFFFWQEKMKEKYGACQTVQELHRCKQK